MNGEGRDGLSTNRLAMAMACQALFNIVVSGLPPPRELVTVACLDLQFSGIHCGIHRTDIGVESLMVPLLPQLFLPQASPGHRL